MNLEDELNQLKAYYGICNYMGQLYCASLIKGINDILNGEETTIDIHCSTREELEARIYSFYMNIDEHLTCDK